MKDFLLVNFANAYKFLDISFLGKNHKFYKNSRIYQAILLKYFINFNLDNLSVFYWYLLTGS